MISKQMDLETTMSTPVVQEKAPVPEPELVHDPLHEKLSSVDEKGVDESKPSASIDMEYTNDDEEPELHARTYVALAAMFLLNLVQVVALQGPPAAVRSLEINQSLYILPRPQKLTRCH